MSSVPNRLRLFVPAARFCGAMGVASALLLGPVPSASAALLSSALHIGIFTVNGSAVNTVTNLVFLNDVTFQIESEEVGSLTHFGNFTGHFSYLAVASPLTITLVGTATLKNDQGEELFLAASVLEVGADYPRSLNGTLTVTGGTGRFAGATGSIAVSGTDEESLTDTVTLKGALITLH